MQTQHGSNVSIQSIMFIHTSSYLPP